MKRVFVFAVLVLTGVITTASAELTKGNVIRDGGFEITPEISSVQVWEEWKEPTTNPVEIDIHNTENPNGGEHSLYLNGYNDPGYELTFWGGVKNELTVPVPVSQLETLNVDINNNPAGIFYGQYNKVNFISNTGDILGFVDYVPSFPIDNWNDDPHHKFTFYELSEEWEGKWEPRELEVWQNWQTKALPPHANIVEVRIYTCGQIWNDNLYGIESWTDNISLTPTEFLTYDASIDNTAFRESSLDVYIRNNGTEASDAFDVRLRIYDSSNEEVYNQIVEVGTLDSDQTEVVSFEYSLNPGTYKFVLTTGGLENFVLDQSSENDWKVFDDVVVGITEHPETSPLISAVELQSGSIHLSYSFPASTPYTLSIYDVTGRGVHNQTGQLASYGQITYNPMNMSEGVYFWRVETDAGEESGKFVWVR